MRDCESDCVRDYETDYKSSRREHNKCVSVSIPEI